MRHVLVRPMIERDVPDVAAARVLGWQQAYAGIVPQPQLDAMSIKGDIARRLAYFRDPANPTDSLVAEVDGGVRGWACVGPCRDDDLAAGWGEIWAIYVRPDNWRLGLGRALMAAALRRLGERRLSPVSLWVLADNDGARRFYESSGFALEGRSKTYAVQGGEVPEVRYRRDALAPRSSPRA